MTLDKIIYDIREQVNAFSDDSEIDDRYIIHLYNIKRPKYLRQDLNNFNRSIDKSIQQKFCLKMEKVSSDTCGIKLDCGTILRSTQPIPKPLELHTKSAIVSINPTNILSLPFNFINIDRLHYIKNSAFPNNIYSFIGVDNYVYVYSLNESYELIECLSITGVFEDPLELQNYKNCCDCEEEKPCFDMMTTDYPLQPHYIDIIRNEVVQSLIGKLHIPTDKTNDSEDQNSQQ